jgi:hypothetical protein
MLGDVRILKGAGPTLTLGAEDRTASSLAETIKAGDVVKRAGTGGNFAVLALDGDAEIATDILFGVVRKESSETATVDGEIEVRMFGADTIIRAKATTYANIDTAAEFVALRYDTVCFDRSAATSAGALTIDEDEGDDPNVHSLMMMACDTVKGTIDAAVNIMATWRGNYV